MAAGTRFIRIAFDGNTKGLNRATKKGGRLLGAFRGTIGKAAGALAGLFAIRQTFSFFGDAIKDAEAFSTAQAITNKIIEQTGGAARVSEKDISKLTSAYARQTGISDTLIREGANVLLTFKNIRNEAGKGNKIFDRSTKLTADMASVFGGDLTSNAKILGKALNDPTAGISALTRVGVTFTEQQKDQIKALQESGDTIGAQKIVLGELESQVGGTAAASANATDKIKVVWEQVRRAIGDLLLPMLDKLAVFFEEKILPLADKVKPLVAELRDRLAPILAQVSAFVKDTVVPILITLGKWVVQNRDFFVPFVAILAAALAGFKAFMFIKTVITAVKAFNLVLAANPIGIVVVALAALVAGLIYAYKNSETFRRIVDAVFKAVASAARWMADRIGAAVRWIADRVSAAASWIGDRVASIRRFFSDLPGNIRSAFGRVYDLITSPFRRAFSAVKNWWNSTVAGFGFSVPSWIPGVGGKEFRIPRMARGGIVRASAGGTLAQIGEGGQDEAVIPLNKLDDMLGGVTVNVAISAEAIAGIARVEVRKGNRLIKRAVVSGASRAAVVAP